MLESYNGGARINGVFDALGGKASGINFARPKVPGNGEQVRVSEKRLEGSGQIRF